MKLSRMSRAEVMAVLGGVVLILGLFLPWYSVGKRNAINDIPGPVILNAWQSFPILRWILLVTAISPFVLAYIILRQKSLSWPHGEMSAVTSMVATVLILYVLLIARPGTVRGLTSLEFGGFVALVGALLMAGGAALRASSERPARPPGVL